MQRVYGLNGLMTRTNVPKKYLTVRQQKVSKIEIIIKKKTSFHKRQ